MKIEILIDHFKQGQRPDFNLWRNGGRQLLLCLFCILAAQRGAAQFPAMSEDETTPSMGVFRLVVDPLFRPLLGPTGPPSSFAGYPGFHSSDGRLTSPVLIDDTTTIGLSKSNPRPTPFPQPVGAPPGVGWDTISGYGDYPAIPFTWFTAPAGSDEVLTEIKSFALMTIGTGQGCTNPTVPMAPPGYVMVKAGTAAGVSPRSLGIVQQDTFPGADFPARSFFDIFVEVNLPSLIGTESSVAFPPTGAVLTNGPPLIVTNLSLGSLPPDVIYLHDGTTNAVELRFKFNNPPFWVAGDLFGTLILAGHGTLTNDCSQEAALLAATLGTTTTSMPELPTGWLRTNTMAPSPGSAYVSLMSDTNPPITSDILTYSVGGSALYVRNVIHYNFPNPVPPPPTNNTVLYTDPNSQINFQISLDQNNWFPAQGTGVVAVTMHNTTPAGSSTATFATQITQMQLQVASPFGNLILRASTSMPSLGMHSIRQDPRGYRISSFFDVFTELSTDGGATYIPADRSLRVQASAPAAAPGTLFISRTSTAGGLNLQWLGPFTLQQASLVRGPYTDISGSTGGPLTNSWPITVGSAARFFRLRQ